MKFQMCKRECEILEYLKTHIEFWSEARTNQELTEMWSSDLWQFTLILSPFWILELNFGSFCGASRTSQSSVSLSWNLPKLVKTQVPIVAGSDASLAMNIFRDTTKNDYVQTRINCEKNNEIYSPPNQVNLHSGLQKEKKRAYNINMIHCTPIRLLLRLPPFMIKSSTEQRFGGHTPLDRWRVVGTT